jgi:hypothetical protein
MEEPCVAIGWSRPTVFSDSAPNLHHPARNLVAVSTELPVLQSVKKTKFPNVKLKEETNVSPKEETNVSLKEQSSRGCPV